MPVYPNCFPATYQPYGYYQPYNQPMQQSQPTQQTQQIQNGGFITVRSETEARNYPVAPGTSVTFKHESAPYCYTKTMGFSQFDSPRFEKFKLVKEEDQDPVVESGATYATQDDLVKVANVVRGMSDMVESMKSEIDTLKSDVYGKRKPVKMEEEE